ncbi:phospholipid scramblase 2-like [Amphiura filiformis]|uniref:phospholipid scramblase 2-like n=1 Tax=Amphiura filiformis TaxID=82378 RepID=UPI003B21F062
MAEAVTQQPESSGESELGNPPIEWMSLPSNVPVCPPGLEYLTHLDQLLVYQQIEIFEALTNIDMRNQYQIRNAMGQQVYAANEESTFCWRFWCGSKRRFAMVITDTNGQEVIRINRPFKCCAGPESCHYAHIDSCSDEMTVEAPPGTIVGKIQHAISKWYPHVHVKDPDGNVLFNIWGPCCQCQTVCCRTDTLFKVIFAKNE